MARNRWSLHAVLQKLPACYKMDRHQTVTATAFRKKPVWFNLINRAWRSTYFLGTKINLTKDHLIKLARKRTGLHSFGNDFWEEPLVQMLDSIEGEAQLSPAGRFITQTRLTGLLAIRLRAENDFKKYPQILQQELYPVQLICGLQRTGTTKLQRLLAADPDNRVLLSWEAINPVPLSDDPSEKQKRIQEARISERALQLMAPGFFAIHPVEHQQPEEDILLLDTTFMSTTTEATMHVPSYAAWLEKTDQTIAYQYMIKLLKYLQFQRPAKRWVLKSPHHLEFLDIISKEFDAVHFIWTHRDISNSLPSFLSMVAHSQSIFSESVSTGVVAQHWVRKTAYMLSRGIAFRKSHPAQPFTDVFYDQLVTDPIAVLSAIYQRHGQISKVLREQFLQAGLRHRQFKYGMHSYCLEDFGWSSEQVKRDFQFYTTFLNTLSN